MAGRIDRRTFLAGGVAFAARRALVDVRLETFVQWRDATPETRAAQLGACVDRIREADSSIQAWVQVAPQMPTGAGALSHIPFGAKDIIETSGLATEYGSPIYKGRIGRFDAAIVKELRNLGGVLVGKTHTTSFAYRTPAPTRNPRDLAHTPGGSSSGSAAAVAAGMVPLTIGTQTGGSILRPASFCGVAGFKTTYGLLSTDGVLPFAKSLDTLGFFTHTAADMLAFWTAMRRDDGGAEPVTFGVVDPLPPVDPPMAAAFSDAIARLRRAGVPLRSIDIAATLDRLAAAQRVVMFYEGARFHEQRYREYGDRLADMAVLVREGLQISPQEYEEARRFIAECRTRSTEWHQTTPVILVPAAVGAAPRGLAFTGDSRMNAPWTALGTPAISIPMPVASGLPLGLQLTAAHNQDARLLHAAVAVERALKKS
jgi:Asp-tRNA(Asn)/Glu-tRNA(Gln) amidotransferase A subunit family amidase